MDQASEHDDLHSMFISCACRVRLGSSVGDCHSSGSNPPAAFGEKTLMKEWSHGREGYWFLFIICSGPNIAAVLNHSLYMAAMVLAPRVL